MNTRGGLASPAPRSAPQQYLTFVLGGETYAMGIRSIKEVIQYGALTQVPLMPGAIRGVINLRGAVVPVIDLAVRFGQVPMEISRRSCIVILEVDREDGPAVLGVIVDQVKAVREIPAEDIEPAPAFGSALRSEFLGGIGKVGDDFVIVLDVDYVLSMEEREAMAPLPDQT
ncbi:chemotaxis protein CheW [Mesoterricola silvestris]